MDTHLESNSAEKHAPHPLHLQPHKHEPRTPIHFQQLKHRLDFIGLTHKQHRALETTEQCVPDQQGTWPSGQELQFQTQPAWEFRTKRRFPVSAPRLLC